MASDEPKGPPPPPIGPWIALCAGVALWIDFGSIHRLHHADSLLPTLMSLIRWEPYFWEQDRFGMLVPLLATPLRHPLANLLFQDFLDLTLGLSAFFLLARYTLRDATYPAAAAIACGSFLTLTPPAYRFSYLVDACYGTWLVPGLAGLILLGRDAGPIRSRRRFAGWVLIALAHWASIASALYLGPLVLARAALGRFILGSRSALAEGIESLAALAAGVGFGLAFMRLSPYHGTDFGGLSPEKWPWALGQLLAVTIEDMAPWGHAALMIVAAGIGLATTRKLGGSPANSARSAVALLASATVTTLFLGTRSWGVVNGFPSRYLSPPVIFATVALAGLAASPLKIVLMPRFIWAATLLTCAIVGYGWPSPGGVRRDLDEAIGRETADLLASECTHVTGYYWNVWPAVFHARLVLFERGDLREVWGITHRCDPTRDLWMSVPIERVKVGLASGDPEALDWLVAYKLPPFVIVDRLATIRVLRPASVSSGVSSSVPSR